jgi:predicted aspartyl protease
MQTNALLLQTAEGEGQRTVLAIDDEQVRVLRLAQNAAMGTFFVRCKIENPAERSKSAIVSRILVDTGSEYTWIPKTILEKIGIGREDKKLSFIMANGQTITREVGFAIIRLSKFFTIDEVVFAEKGDLTLLGARTLEGLNLTIDARRKKLIAAGPLPAAATKAEVRGTGGHAVFMASTRLS